ncbi:hypothetical protein P8452_33288 [Trifolium repens]|nr:hypothetical protein P8452_33288 [Trifolium repens]
MASSWFIMIMPFKFLHHVAWPLLALLYPMCASVQAIETDSYEETKHLISYWILLSSIYLFEYAFMSLLPWFQLWMYIKLIFIFWLTMPDFGRASYVYNNLIHAMKLQIVTWRLNNYWRKWFFDKDNFLMHAERYMNENGTEALEKLIASKNTMCRPDAEVTNEIIVTDNKEMLKTNGERLQIEQKDIKNLEAIEKQEILVTKQDIPVMPIIGPSPNASSATVETKGAADSGRAGGEVPHSSASTEKEVQKEWTCALCLVTALSEQVWNAHLNGRKHRASLQKQKDAKVTNEIISTGNKEILKTNEEKHQTEHKDIKDFEAVEKKEIHETKQDIPGMSKIEPCQNASSATVETKVTAESDRAGGERQKDAEVTSQLITTDNKEILKTNGERLKSEHKDIKDLEAIEKKEIPSSKQDILVIPKIGPSQTASSATVETKGRAESDTVGGEVSFHGKLEAVYF